MLDLLITGSGNNDGLYSNPKFDAPSRLPYALPATRA